MNILLGILAGIAVGALIAVVIYIVYLTIKKLKEIIKARKERNAKHQVAFGRTQKILDEKAKQMIEESPSVSMSQLESMCKENPYFVVDYDPETDEVYDYQMIKTDQTEDRVENIIKEEGIVLFE